jgi:hypothetical protein
MLMDNAELINPLVIYKTWFNRLDLDWADTIAIEFFSSMCLFHDRNDKFNTTYGYDEQLEPRPSGTYGIKLNHFLNLLISKNKFDTISKISVNLFSITQYTTLNFDKEPLFDILNLYNDLMIKHLLKGDHKEVVIVEELIRIEEENQLIRKQIKVSWDIFALKSFNFDTINQYEGNQIKW